MKAKSKIGFLCVMGLFLAITFSSCVTTRENGFSQYNFSLKNTLAIFLQKNEKGHYFCIPLQYVGDYQISRLNSTRALYKSAVIVFH
jgi:hypothetical protein